MDEERIEPQRAKDFPTKSSPATLWLMSLETHSPRLPPWAMSSALPGLSETKSTPDSARPFATIGHRLFKRTHNWQQSC